DASPFGGERGSRSYFFNQRNDEKNQVFSRANNSEVFILVFFVAGERKILHKIPCSFDFSHRNLFYLFKN
ncbi:MAG TPA: hypothetical protein VMW77_06290, partial [Methanoregula sp.]|nr:hypothetical protein [Methanoregula sp.]